MQEITKDNLTESNYLLYIHTPFCGTCHIARSMLDHIEVALDKQVFYEMNASFFPEFMEENEISSVPCLLIKVDGDVKEKIYAFHSTANIVHFLLTYRPEMFDNHRHLLS